MKNIIIAGSINMDIVAQMDKHPENGETVFGKKISFIPGGKGANQVRAISRLEGKVALVGKLGKDQFGKSLLRSLNTDGINTGNIKISQNNTTGVALIGVDRQAENRITIVSGANFDLSPKDISKIDLQKNTIAISQFEVPQNTIKAFFKKAKKAKAQTILNPSPTGKIPPDLLKLVDYLIVNEHEFAYLSNTKKLQIDSASLAKNANRIVAIDQVIITTFGAKGSVAIKGSKVIKAPGFKVKAVDTTGAGDSFLGSFSQALAEGRDLKDALTFANAAAALKVTKLGASSMPYRSEVDKFIQDKMRQKNHGF